MLQAQGNYYLVQSVEVDKVSSGGIILRDTGTVQYGEICSVGGGIEKPLPVGAKIIMNWNQSVPIKTETQQVFAVHPDHIFARVED